tara:strand:- start:1923 stop:2471 length:549 start_codon:yes stop_codon:yes gene_type:complete
MKYVKTFEAYIAYDKLGGNWGSPDDIQKDIETTLVNLLKYGEVNQRLGKIEFEDQSTDKGIKFEVTINGSKGKDILHAFKDGKMRGEYEWYLNKKKSSSYDIQEYFLNKYVSELEQYIAMAKAFDINYEYADGKPYKEGKEQAIKLRDVYGKLSTSDRKKAYKEFIKIHKKSDRDVNSFTGS